MPRRPIAGWPLPSSRVDVIPGVRGRLVTAAFCRDVLPTLTGAEPVPASISRMFERWFLRADAALGPASGVRSVAEIAAIPLLRILGYTVRGRTDGDHTSSLQVVSGDAQLAVVVTGWGEPLDSAWRAAVRDSVALDARWIICCNGNALRIVDGRRSWSRDFLEFDLAVLADETGAQTALWSLARAAAMAKATPLLDVAVDLSARHGIEVCRALGTGVLESLTLLYGALRLRRGPPRVLFEQSLTVLYRILFLLFAEARGLVPVWHPVYRDRYSLDTIVSALLTGSRYRGLWHAIQAISRLAHNGCTTSGLRVTAFNGRLFAPSQVRTFDRAPIDDSVMGRVVLAVSSTPVNRATFALRAQVPKRAGARIVGASAHNVSRARIAYRDLDVEQLGAVYEQVLEYEPEAFDSGIPDTGHRTLKRTRDARKSSGTFYTPRAVTAALVRRTLEPLVSHRTSDQILALRVLDPAMGSGAFLVGACRYLAAAAEEALCREGRWHPYDVTAADRVELRRQVAARCLFGVDLNPMAVQLARLSLWLVTLAADKPLSFLDHHLVAGDSLVGASPADLRRQPSRTRRLHKRLTPLTLFETGGLESVLESAARLRSTLATEPDDTVSVIRAKERTLAELDAGDGPLGRWRRALDLWCAGWFLEHDPPDRGTFQELVQHTLHGRSSLAPAVARPLLARADAVAARRHFLHWELAFPEVFVDAHGRRRADAGFDAVVGNPPWDMLRGDSGDQGTRVSRRADARMMSGFVREAGVYRIESLGHVNRYQLFVERALQLVKSQGRIGLVLPSGAVSDVGAAPLRRYLFDRADVDAITGLDNREAIFPIHRSMRFVLLTCTSGSPTRVTRCRFGITKGDDLESEGEPLVLSRPLIARLSGEDDLGIPELASARDLQIVERIASRIPRLGSEDGWNASFGRELNASDDRAAFVTATRRSDSRPVVEGKQVEPFRVAVDRCRLELGAAARVRIASRERLAYRDVASAGNRLTLIAAIVPERAVTTHTLFCLKQPRPLREQQVLCALLNSFVANYLVRLRVTTHVTASLMSRLRVPLVRTDEPAFARLAVLTQRLQQSSDPVEELPAYAELQGIVARLYQLTAEDFEHVLRTFPLIPLQTRRAALAAFGQCEIRGA
jgi:hypothetical protein